MTVYQQVNQTIADLKSVQASFELFSYQTKDAQAVKAFQDAFEQTKHIITDLETRVLQIEKEEPTYKTLGQQKQPKN
ncbi:MAG: DUF1657 domain-containing protein [Tuberibacillus sp.]